MKKFKLIAMLCVSAWTEVEAETEEEAIAIAKSRDPGRLCHNAISPGHDECWHFQNDGEPCHVEIDRS
jgi:hypothetical protein